MLTRTKYHPLRLLLLTLCAALFAAGCTGEIGNDNTNNQDPQEPESELLTPEEVGEGSEKPVDTVDKGEGELVPITPRARRRLDIDQLDEAVFLATGQRWVVDDKNQYAVLAATLGVPNYIEETLENVAPTIIFQRFLGESGRTTCHRAAEAEADGMAENPVLMVEAGPTVLFEDDPTAIDSNLVRLLKRFHGTHLAPDSAQLEPWRDLFTGVTQSHLDKGEEANPVQAWKAVCVALITHPDFYSY